MEVCGYVGPAPVSLEAYSAMLRWQFANTPEVKPEHVTAALSGLVLAPQAVQLAGLAVSSGRSLFVYGPSGNGKSSLGRQIHAALQGDYWIPYCISVGNSVIRAVRRAGPPARRGRRGQGRRPSTSAGSASAGRWSSSAAS